MTWTWPDYTGTVNFTSSTAGTDTITLTTGNTTLDLPDSLIDWFPYKWKKYIPTWHLVKSYGVDKFEVSLIQSLIENDGLIKRLAKEEIVSLDLPKNESLEDYEKDMEQITEDCLDHWDDK